MEYIRFTEQDLNKLNQLVTKYFKPEFDIYFMQGVVVSGLSCCELVNIPKLFFGNEAIIPMLHEQIDINDINEFLQLFLGLHHNCVEQLICYKTFIPLINLNKIRSEYVAFDELADEEQQNLLSWYLGYFFGVGRLWDFGKLDAHLQRYNVDLDGETLYQSFFNAFYAQLLVVNILLDKFNPKFRDAHLRDTQVLVKDLFSKIPPYLKYKLEVAEFPQYACLLLEIIFLCTKEAFNIGHMLHNIKRNNSVH
jgi:hypothetical protein